MSKLEAILAYCERYGRVEDDMAWSAAELDDSLGQAKHRYAAEILRSVVEFVNLLGDDESYPDE